MSNPGEDAGVTARTGEGMDHVQVDRLADASERSLEEAAAACERKDLPLKIRTALQIFDPDKKPYGAFRGWRGQAWTLTVSSIPDAKQLRQAIELMFDLIQIGGVDTACNALRAMRQRMLAERTE